MAELKSEILFELRVDLAEPQEVGATPHGTRLVIYVRGGSFEGPRLKGTVLPGGGDWMLIRPDGAGELDIRATLRTDDGHLIYTSYRGLFHAAPEILARVLRGEPLPPADSYLRTVPFFETASDKYAWLNRLVAVGIGTRTPAGVDSRVYAIL